MSKTFLWACAQFLFLQSHVLIAGFNIDAGLSRVISGPKRTFFGYTVGVMMVHQEPRIVVGAPKSNLTSHPDWTEPGSVYVCELGKTTTCEEVDMGKNGDESLEGVAQQWLGASLDIWTSRSGKFHKILACAPLWKNTNYKKEYLVQGRCHEVGYGSEITFREVYTPLQTRKSEQEQVTANQVYLKAMGQAGISAEYVKDHSSVLVGAPGLFNWRGGVAFIKNDSRPNYQPFWLKDEFSGEMGAGYSVASGVFFSDMMAHSVTGVPRWNGVGKIIIFESSFENILTERVGEQFGAYFGASLCVTNFNGDTYDDVLVGAPLYSDVMEEGRVYAYVSRGLSAITNNRILKGKNKYRSRFGTAIMGIGDVDKDGYNDVAVGAPFADGMAGAVYIYHGSILGMSEGFSQEILGRSVDTGLRGFGWSFSKPLDTNNNGYQDFAVGSFLSDHVVLLKTRPVAKVEAYIDLEREVINLMQRECYDNGRPHSCLHIDIVFIYTGQYVPEEIEIEYELLSDTNPDDEYEVGRAQIGPVDGPFSSSLHQKLYLTLGKETRLKFRIVIKPKLDTFTDVVFKLNFNKTRYCPPDLDPSQCPVLSNKISRTLNASLAFRKECDSVRGCISDLKLQSTAPKSLLVGATPFITVKVIVTNRGEAAYLSMVTLRCQEDIKVAAVDTIEVPRDNPEGITNIRCSSSRQLKSGRSAAKTVLECNVGNPLRTGNRVSFLVKLDVRDMEPLGRFTTVELEASTKSEERNVTLYNNYNTLLISLSREVHLQTNGFSRPEQLTYRKEKSKAKQQDTPLRRLHLDHHYSVINRGRSISPDVTINISVPIRTRSGSPLYQITAVEILSANGNSRDIEGGCQTSHLPPFEYLNETEALVGEKQTEMTPTVTGRLTDMFLNCSSAICVTIPCQLTRLRRGSEAILTVYGRIYEHSITSLQACGIIKLQTNGTVLLNEDTIGSESSFTHQTIIVTTEIFPQVFSRSHLKTWLLAVCISTGVILMMFVYLILWKVGFFRRAKQEELQRLISRSDLTPSDSGRGTNSTSTDNEAGMPEDVSSAAGQTDSEPPESPRYPDDVDFDTLSRSTSRETKNFIFDRPDRAFSNLTYDEATRFGTRV